MNGTKGNAHHADTLERTLTAQLIDVRETLRNLEEHASAGRLDESVTADLADNIEAALLALRSRKAGRT